MKFGLGAAIIFASALFLPASVSSVSCTKEPLCFEKSARLATESIRRVTMPEIAVPSWIGYATE